MKADLKFAKDVLNGAMAFDQPLGRLMEIIQDKDDAPETGAIKDCCGTLLRVQFELIERITKAYPELGGDGT